MGAVDLISINLGLQLGQNNVDEDTLSVMIAKFSR